MVELYVTGVEQNSCKNIVTTGLVATMQCLGYSTGVYKPVDVGAKINNGYIESNDLVFVKEKDKHIKTYFTYLLKENISPILAGAVEKIEIEKDAIIRDYGMIKNLHECLLVDGLWGLGTPYGKDFLEEDVVKCLNLPLILVVSAENSDLSNVLLAINRTKEKNINLRGIIVTNFDEQSVRKKLIPKIIEEYSGAKVLGALPQIEKDINPSDLIMETINNIDVEKTFDISIAKLK